MDELMQSLKINSPDEIQSAFKKIRKERKVSFIIRKTFIPDLNQSIICAYTRIVFVFYSSAKMSVD
jgi:hypothetical protein